MASSVKPKPNQQKTYPLFRIKPWDVFTGLPAGALIFMSTVLFNTLFNVNSRLSVFVPIVILALMSLLVGLLIGPAGIIVTLFISPLGGWLGARLRKAL